MHKLVCMYTDSLVLAPLRILLVDELSCVGVSIVGQGTETRDGPTLHPVLFPVSFYLPLIHTPIIAGWVGWVVSWYACISICECIYIGQVETLSS